jgi:hypothetical protein
MTTVQTEKVAFISSDQSAAVIEHFIAHSFPRKKLVRDREHIAVFLVSIQ